MIAPASSLSAGHVRVRLADPSGVGEARRLVGRIAASAQLDEVTAGKVALVVTESATNVLKHAGGGTLLARVLEAPGAAGVEVIALDRGPGIANVGDSMRDGHSTAGTPGGGLGALRRASSTFEIWTRTGGGTIVRCEIWSRPPRGRGLAYGTVCVAKDGEPVCGDAWTVAQARAGVLFFVVDGLGHGPDAAHAARTAVETARAALARDPADLMDAVHRALRPTRGAAAAVALLQPQSELCTFCGVGNISAVIRDRDGVRSLVSHNGTLGHQVRKLQEFTYPFRAGALLVLHSDGVATRWDLDGYPGLDARHPAVAAAALYRDFERGRDDATVLAARNRMEDA